MINATILYRCLLYGVLYLTAGGLGIGPVGCQSRRAHDWTPLLRTTDSLMAVGDTTAAIEIIRQFTQDDNQTAGKADTAGVAIMERLAGQVEEAGDLRLAEQLYTLALGETGSSKHHSALDRANLQQQLGQIYVQIGQFDKGEALFDSVLMTRRLLLGERQIEYASVMKDLGALCSAKGDVTEALNWFGQALAIYHDANMAESPEVGVLLGMAGNPLTALAQNDSAEAAYARSIHILERYHPKYAYQYSAAVLNLAALYADLGQSDSALQYYNQALDVVTGTYGSRHPRAAIILSGIGTLEFDNGNWPEAEDKFRKAIALYESRGAAEVAWADCEYNLGNLFFRQQKFDSAEVHATRALALFEQTVGADHPDMGEIHALLAQIHGGRGEWAEARREDQLGFSICRNQFLTHYASLSEPDARRFATAFQEQTSYYLTTLIRSQDMRVDTCRELGTLLLLSKGLVQDGAFARRRLIGKDEDTATKTIVDSLQQLRVRIAHLSTYMSQAKGSTGLQQELEILKAQSAGVETELATRNPIHREYVDVPIDSVQAALERLPRGSNVLDYFVYDKIDLNDEHEPHYLVSVYCDTGFVTCADLGAAKTIERRVREYRTYLENPRAATGKQVVAASRALCNMVWAPIAKYLDDATMLYICPDGELNLVSFAGLCGDDERFLIEQFPIHYLSSPRDLAHHENEGVSGKGMIVVGDPDYGGALPKLSHAGEEVRTVANAWQSVYAEPLTVMTGGQASEREFRKVCTGVRAMYFAAHSTDALKPSASAKEDDDTDILPNGILLSEFRGLTPDADTDNDGLLAAEEILGLDLRGTELVVLSTCESGGGKVVRGEGVYGLRRAFQMAGAQTVISTLWPVDDRSTAELMKYGLFDGKEGYPQALQRACLERIKELRAEGETANPFSWAAFVSAGR